MTFVMSRYGNMAVKRCMYNKVKQDLSLKCSAWKSLISVSISQSLGLSLSSIVLSLQSIVNSQQSKVQSPRSKVQNPKSMVQSPYSLVLTPQSLLPSPQSTVHSSQSLAPSCQSLVLNHQDLSSQSWRSLHTKSQHFSVPGSLRKVPGGVGWGGVGWWWGGCGGLDQFQGSALVKLNNCTQFLKFETFFKIPQSWLLKNVQDH